MKSLIILIISISHFVHADSKGYEACFLDDAEKNRCEVKIVDGKKEGKETCRALDNSKVILLEAQYAKGKLNGPLVCRDFMNQVYMQTTYVDDKLNGEHKDFSKTRSWRNIKEAWAVKYFENGKQVGMEFYADSKGKVLDILPNCWEKGQFSSSNFGYCLGLKYGDYDADIKKYLQTEVKKRFKEMNRDIEDRYKNGKIKFKARMVDGRYDGEALWNYESGSPNTKTLYAKGVPVKSEEFFESGAPQLVKQFKDGKLEKKETYYENGKLAETVKTTYDDGVRKERIERFDDKGFRETEYGYTYEFSSYWGQMDGPYRTYDAKGRLDYEAYFKNGQLDGKVTINSGNRREDENWVKGKHIDTIVYDAGTGKPIEKIEYMSDGSEKTRTKLNAISI
jgi:antitoxin component YwqK of YwqJK toxin-antitoxin module